MHATLRWVDALSLLVFALVGRVHHAASIVASDLLLTVAPLFAAWYGVAVAAGTYRGGGARALLWNWIVAVPLAVAARQLLRGQPFGGTFWQFLIVALVMTLAFLAAGRVIAYRAAGWRAAADRGTNR